MELGKDEILSAKNPVRTKKWGAFIEYKVEPSFQGIVSISKSNILRLKIAFKAVFDYGKRAYSKL